MTTTLNASTAGAGGFIATGDNSGSLALQTAGTTAVTIDTSQRVFLNSTAVPTGVTGTGVSIWNKQSNTGLNAINTVASASDAFTYLGTNATVGAIGVSYGNTAGYLPLAFYTSDAEKMRIDTSGNLLVGTTSTITVAGIPSGNAFKTSVQGNTLLTGQHTNATDAKGIVINYTTDFNSNGQAPYFFYAGSTTRFVVNSNGGIQNYSANNVNLSDQREKKNIELAPNYLDKVCAIPVKTFLFNDQTDTEKNLGAIAQEVQAVAPELVHESNWGTEEEPKMRLSIYQTDLQYALMKSIQELKAINDTQAETLTQQTEAINALTARVVALESRGTV